VDSPKTASTSDIGVSDTPFFIPVLSSDTANPNTFDLDRLLDPKVQKFGLSAHRFNTSTTVGKVMRRAESDVKQTRNPCSYGSANTRRTGKKSIDDINKRFDAYFQKS
jgi:hypothetical protein